MTSSSHSSDEGFLESLEISLEEAKLVVDADTHASVTGIYAQVSSLSLLLLLLLFYYYYYYYLFFFFGP